jgi:iron complex transport system substrate-binding protein
MRSFAIRMNGLALRVLLLLGASALSAWLVDRGHGAAATGPSAVAPPTRPERIVSTNLAADEVLLALLPPERILALSHFADDPAISNVLDEARAVPHRVRGEAEPILALAPDVVFAFPFGQRDVELLLRQAGVAVVHVPGASSFDEVSANIHRIGEVTGEPAGAAGLVDAMERTLDHVRHRVAGTHPPRVLIWYTGGTTSGGDTLIDALLRIAGGRNVVAEAGVDGVATLPLETALELDPDVIFVLDFRADARTREVGGRHALTDHPVWRTLDAVREGRVHVLPARYAYATSHHAAQAAVDMARRLHPERFAGGAP